MKKVPGYLNFNLDVLARPMKQIYNDEVSDLTQAQEVLKKFMLGPQNDSTIRKTPGS
jgi:hypothetical protein